ncbi:TRAP transporter small permease subunit, partial [Halomonas sp. SIMBA_159]
GRGKWLVVAAVNLLGAVLAGVFFAYSLDATLPSLDRGTMVRQTLVFPEWWALSVMPISMALMVVEFLRRLVRGAGERQQVGL